jgi:hypothetical protein
MGLGTGMGMWLRMGVGWGQTFVSTDAVAMSPLVNSAVGGMNATL